MAGAASCVDDDDSETYADGDAALDRIDVEPDELDRDDMVDHDERPTALLDGLDDGTDTLLVKIVDSVEA